MTNPYVPHVEEATSDSGQHRNSNRHRSDATSAVMSGNRNGNFRTRTPLIRRYCHICGENINPILVVVNEDGVTVGLTMRCPTCSSMIGVAEVR